MPQSSGVNPNLFVYTKRGKDAESEMNRVASSRTRRVKCEASIEISTSPRRVATTEYTDDHPNRGVCQVQDKRWRAITIINYDWKRWLLWSDDFSSTLSIIMPIIFLLELG